MIAKVLELFKALKYIRQYIMLLPNNLKIDYVINNKLDESVLKSL